jgi:uncharacterized protein YcnI
MHVRKLVLALAAAGALVAVPAAGAHVTVSPVEAAAGSYGFFEFTVPHGCDDSPTTKLTVKLPEGITSATPEVVPGWDVAKTMRTLDEPVEAGHGETIDEVVDTISWTGGPLPIDQLTRFGLSVKLPEGAGTTLYFPTVQECESGETRWIQIPAEDGSEVDLDEPAPAVSLVAADGASGDGATAANGAVAASAGVDETGSGSSTLAIALGAAGLAAGLLALGIVLVRRPGKA